MGAQTGPEQIEKIESYIKLAEEDDKANILTVDIVLLIMV